MKTWKGKIIKAEMKRNKQRVRIQTLSARARRSIFDRTITFVRRVRNTSRLLFGVMNRKLARWWLATPSCWNRREEETRVRTRKPKSIVFDLSFARGLNFYGLWTYGDFPRTAIKTDCSAELVESAIKHPEKRKFFLLSSPIFILIYRNYVWTHNIT